MRQWAGALPSSQLPIAYRLRGSGGRLGHLNGRSEPLPHRHRNWLRRTSLSLGGSLSEPPLGVSGIPCAKTRLDEIIRRWKVARFALVVIQVFVAHIAKRALSVAPLGVRFALTPLSRAHHPAKPRIDFCHDRSAFLLFRGSAYETEFSTSRLSDCQRLSTCDCCEYPNLAAYVARGEAARIPVDFRPLNWRFTPASHRPADLCPSWARSRHPSFSLGPDPRV